MVISIYTAKLLKTILWMALRSFEYTIKFSKGFTCRCIIIFSLIINDLRLKR